MWLSKMKIRSTRKRSAWSCTLKHNLNDLIKAKQRYIQSIRALGPWSSNKLPQELKLIKKFTTWNDFPKYLVNSNFRKTLQAHKGKSGPNLTTKQKEPVVVYFRFPYYGYKCLQLLKFCIRKIKLNCKKDHPVVFKILYDVCKMEFFCNTKDRTPTINQSFVVYSFTCPDCGANYVGNT